MDQSLITLSPVHLETGISGRFESAGGRESKVPNKFPRHALALTIFEPPGVVATLSTHPSTHLRRTSPLIFSCLLLGGQFSPAQDALRTAIAGDRSEVARQLTAATPGNERIKAGPFEFNVGLSYGLEYTDNVRNVRSPREEDFVQTPVLDLNGFLPVTDTGRLSLGFGVGYADYFKNNELDRLYFSPNSELAYDFTVKDFRFTLYDSFDYSYDVQGVGALAGVSQFPRFQNTVGLRALWAPSAWSYQAGYSHFNFISDNSGSESSGSGANNFSYLDRSSEQVFGRIAYSVAPATRVGLEVSSALTAYVDDAQPDNISFSIGPFTEWQVTEAITMSLRGGFTHYSFDSTPGSLPSLVTNTAPGVSNVIVIRPSVIRNASESYELNSYYAGFDFNHRLTEFITHGLSASHSIQPGVNQGSDFTESTDFSYRVSWALTQNTSVGADFGYSHGTETQTQIPELPETPTVIDPSLFAPTDEAYDTFRFGLSASYRLSQQATLSLAYSHYRRESNEEERSYFQNRVSVGFRYQF